MPSCSSAMRLRACSEISAQINSSLSKNSGGNGACRKQRELPTLDTSAAPYRSHKETKPMATTSLFSFSPCGRRKADQRGPPQRHGALPPSALSTRAAVQKNSILAKIGGEDHELQASPGRSWREHHSSFCNGMLYFRHYFPD